MNGLREKLFALCESALREIDYELVDLEYQAGRRHATLRVFIDNAAGIRVEDCERASRHLSALLDVEDPISMPYSLEVSSPGFDRVLRKPAHFERFAGSRVLVQLLTPRDGRRRYTGTLAHVDADGVQLLVDGENVAMRYNEIDKARLAP
ncbi:MAG: ribosome maturation factor RimP [Steroidobacteraceae bacterium]